MKKISALILSLGVIMTAQAANYDNNSNSYGSGENQNINVSDKELSQKISEQLGSGWFKKVLIKFHLK